MDINSDTRKRSRSNSDIGPTDDGDGYDASSGSDGQGNVEVLLDGLNALHRRKSSLAAAGANEPKDFRSTACFVHSLIDSRSKKRLPHDHAENVHAGKTSRLLSKRQLADMAWGVRELSQQLGSVRIRLKVRKIFILTKAHDEELVKYTREITEWLLSKDRQHKYTVFVEKTLQDNSTFDEKSIAADDPEAKSRINYWSNDACLRNPHNFDFVITLGGDGTVLYASWLFQRVVPPVLSIALGSLGFLTRFDFKDYAETLTTAFVDGVSVSLRLRFEGTVMRAIKGRTQSSDLVEEIIREEADDEHTHKPEKTRVILNDIVIDRGPNATMSSIELFRDYEHLTTISADGICISTPTGSTAYNLAAGGSLCHPDNPVILLTAICAHTLSFRPVILPDTVVLRVGVPYDARTSSWASFDGRERVEIRPGDYVTIAASRYPFAFVLGKSGQDDWSARISKTLNWNSRKRQKAFDDGDDGETEKNQTSKKASEW